ncbi:hypothetical protein SDJN03_01698, partial [Cucurbita argyrosperma subsp. sororia]
MEHCYSKTGPIVNDAYQLADLFAGRRLSTAGSIARLEKLIGRAHGGGRHSGIDAHRDPEPSVTGIQPTFPSSVFLRSAMPLRVRL